MLCVTFALLSVICAGLAYLLLNNKKICFGNCKGPFTPKVTRMSLRLKKASLYLHLLMISCNTVSEETGKQSNWCYLFEHVWACSHLASSLTGKSC